MKLKLIISIFAVLMLAAFSVTAAGDLDITAIVPGAADPGATATVSVTIQNDAAVPMNVAFTSTTLVNGPNTIAAPTIPDLTGIASGDDGTQAFTIALPALPAGVYTGTLTATDKADATNNDSIAYTVTINPKVSFTVPSSVTVTSPSDSTKNVDITLTNTGSITLGTFSIAYSGETKDNDDDAIVFTFTNPAAIAPGATGTAQMSVDIDNNVDVDNYIGTVNVTANGLLMSISSRVEVIPEICKSGIKGDLDISIDEPDSGETFNPGEQIDIQVNVENNDDSDMDVKVTAIFYNLDENDEIKKVTSEADEIEDGSDKDFDLKMILPTNLDENDDYVLYIKAYEDGREGSNCDFASSDINTERESHKVVVSEINLVPEAIQCGQKLTVQATAENIGTESEDDVYVKLLAKDFGVNKDSETFDLDEFDDSDNEFTTQFTFDVPNNAKGDYYLELVTNFNEGDTESRVEKFTVLCDKVTAEPRATPSAKLNVLTTGLKQDVGGKLTIELLLKNDGLEQLPIKLDVTEAQWAEVLAIEAPAVLNSGDEFHAYVYLKVKENTEPGMHSMRINLRKDSGLIESKLVSVVAEKPMLITGQVVSTTPSWKSWFTDKPKLFWIIADIVLVALAILFIRLLFKK